MELCTILGSPKANSYLSMAELDELMPLYDPNWTTRSEEEKIVLARTSASDVDKIPFLGTRLYLGQSMQWPRTQDALVTSYVLQTGFERVISTREVETTTETLSDDSFTRRAYPNFVEFYLTNPDFQKSTARRIRLYGSEDIPDDGVTGPVHLDYNATLVEETYVEDLPPVTNEFGEVVSGGTSETKVRWKWERFDAVHEDNSTSSLLDGTLPDVQFDFDNYHLKLFNVNGQVISNVNVFEQCVSSWDVVTVETVTGADPSKLTNTGLVYSERVDILPEYFKGASVHAMYGAERLYFEVKSLDTSTGTVVLDGEIPDYWPETGVTFIYHDPLFPAVKEAQLVQMLTRIGQLMKDPFAGLGLSKIQIGDTSRTYATGGGSYSALNDVANRLGVNVQTLIRLGKYSIYCKYSIGWQQYIEDAITTALE